MNKPKPIEATECAVQCYHCEKWFKINEESSGICPYCNMDCDIDDEYPAFISRQDVKYLNYNWDVLSESPKKEVAI